VAIPVRTRCSTSGAEDYLQIAPRERAHAPLGDHHVAWLRRHSRVHVGGDALHESTTLRQPAEGDIARADLGISITESDLDVDHADPRGAAAATAAASRSVRLEPGKRATISGWTSITSRAARPESMGRILGELLVLLRRRHGFGIAEAVGADAVLWLEMDQHRGPGQPRHDLVLKLVRQEVGAF
jgi:hypothetical protein